MRVGACFFYLVVFALPACVKYVQKKGIETKPSSYISWKSCSLQNFGNDAVKICFDSVLEDSRCPIDVVCVWEGTAVAKFSFSVNDDEHDIRLSTVNLPGIYSSDTVLMGYKIEFLDLQPYPQTNNNHSMSDYQAEIKITKQ